jgi:hypothetical protein
MKPSRFTEKQIIGIDGPRQSRNMETIRARMGPDPTGADGAHDRPSEFGGPTRGGKPGSGARGLLALAKPLSPKF